MFEALSSLKTPLWSAYSGYQITTGFFQAKVFAIMQAAIKILDFAEYYFVVIAILRKTVGQKAFRFKYWPSNFFYMKYAPQEISLRTYHDKTSENDVENLKYYDEIDIL